MPICQIPRYTFLERNRWNGLQHRRQQKFRLDVSDSILPRGTTSNPSTSLQSGSFSQSALEQKVKRLLDRGFIGETEANILATVVEAGSAAAHRGWSPDTSEFKTLLTALEQFVGRTVVSGQTALEIKARIPHRHPRPARAD